VRRERQARKHSPCGEWAARAKTCGLAQRDERKRAEQDEQRIRTRLLRIPDEEWADRGERRRDECRPPGNELTAGGVSRRHRRRPERRRQRPETGLVRTENLRPDPGEHVVQRRRRLALGNCSEHPADGRLTGSTVIASSYQ
jgi:hypothetical protein